MSESVERLVELFVKFPGIGPRQARRFVYYLLSQKPVFIDTLVARLQALRRDVKQCTECFRFFPHEAKHDACFICRDPNVDKDTLIVVEKDMDLEALHKSGIFPGRYFVLGGLVPILEKEPNRFVRTNELVEKANQYVKEGLKEIIFALSANPTGDHTVEYLKEILSPIEKEYFLKLSVLGRGLSTGTELEYSDLSTLKNAFENRK